MKAVLLLILLTLLSINCDRSNDNLSRKNKFIKKIDEKLAVIYGTNEESDEKQSWDNITTDELVKMMTSEKKDFVIIDARSYIEYRDSHIPGALSVPASKVKPSTLPQNKSLKIIFYCNGPKCTKSKKAAKKAFEYNYNNIIVYDEGIPEWKKRGYQSDGENFPKVPIPTMTAKKLDSEIDKIYLIDIRDRDELDKGSIDGTKLNIPLDEIDSILVKVSNKDEKIVIFDHVGKQTLLAGRLLKTFGYKNVQRLEGGWIEWIKHKSKN